MRLTGDDDAGRDGKRRVNDVILCFRRGFGRRRKRSMGRVSTRALAESASSAIFADISVYVCIERLSG